ncbi:hypothetical protein RRG08_022772 [Elysia crispata]|uniref:Secreted protein n=1 Tax=Elysia crispata TaxID=231223 RepID=A0AAE0ZWI2_9GAST|nr:hypothetical protein RRG08_022772 [Elysia crispata]
MEASLFVASAFFAVGVHVSCSCSMVLRIIAHFEDFQPDETLIPPLLTQPRPLMIPSNALLAYCGDSS